MIQSELRRAWRECASLFPSMPTPSRAVNLIVRFFQQAARSPPLPSDRQSGRVLSSAASRSVAKNCPPFPRLRRYAKLVQVGFKAGASGGRNMLSFSGILRRTMLAGVAVAALGLGLQPGSKADAENGKRVCVSWRHFQEERWRIDEAGIKSVLGSGRLHLCERRRPGRPAEADDRRRQPAGVEVRRGDHSRAGFEARSCPRSRRPKRPMSQSSPMTCRSILRM